MITTHIQTRGYELDYTRSIPPAVLVRYMEWGRWEYLGTENNEITQSVNSLVVGTQSLVIVSTLREREDLDVLVWLSRVGTASLDISQMIVNKVTKQPIALGRATLVNVGKDRRPAAIAQDVKQLVENAPEGFSDELFLDLSDRTSGMSKRSLQRRVMASEIDLLKHVNHSRYVDYVEDSRKFLFANEDQIAPPISAITVQYRNEALHGQLLDIDVWPTADPNVYQSQIVHNGQVMVNAVVKTTG